MKPRIWSFLVSIVMVIYFAGMVFQQHAIQMVFKPLLVSTMLGYFVSATLARESNLKKWIITALVFSIAGDTLLMFANQHEGFFLWGLIAFLLAHIFYIITFHPIRPTENISGKWQVAIIVAVYYFLLIGLLMPYLGSMKFPVIIYGLVISFMLLIATHIFDLKDNLTARYILTGAIFFVVSDSVLAINKFYQPYEWGAWAIMITYILAQWLIVKGCVRYLLNKSIEA